MNHNYTRMDLLFNLTAAYKSIIRVGNTYRAGSVVGQKAIRVYNESSQAVFNHDSQAWRDWHALYQIPPEQTGIEYFKAL